jgi:hypothetical protein
MNLKEEITFGSSQIIFAYCYIPITLFKKINCTGEEEDIGMKQVYAYS